MLNLNSLFFYRKNKKCGGKITAIVYHHGSPVILSSSFVLSFGAINMLTKKLWEKQFALCDKSSKFSSIEFKLIICGAGHASHRKKHINLMLAQTKKSFEAKK